MIGERPSCWPPSSLSRCNKGGYAAIAWSKLSPGPRVDRRLRVPSGQAVDAGLEQRRHEKAPDHAIKAVVLVEEQPVLAVLARQRHTRQNGEGIDVDLIVASRVPS